MNHVIRTLSAGTVALLLAAAWPAHAQSSIVTKSNPEMKISPDVYWTPERFRAAKPMPMPQATAGAQRPVEPLQPGVDSQGSEGMPPSEEIEPADLQLYSPDPAPQSTKGEPKVDPSAVGTLGAHYTSTRVFPLFTGSAARYSADRAYPYRTVGKLFFSVGGDPFVCSASVIQRRVVATAGHCVHSGFPNGFHADFVFVPSFRDGEAPYRTWNWRFVAVTSTWASGGGTVPNAADYAMLEFADQALSQGAPLSKLGNVTGWLGWQTLALNPNHTSKLGYPCNLDSCQKMQNVTSNSFRATAPNNVEYGSDARGGSSGGPWVQNFEILPVGGGTGLNTGINRVVSVTSYIYNDEAPKVQGGSILDSRWVDLLNALCARSGNCS